MGYANTCLTYFFIIIYLYYIILFYLFINSLFYYLIILALRFIQVTHFNILEITNLPKMIPKNPWEQIESFFFSLPSPPRVPQTQLP